MTEHFIEKSKLVHGDKYDYSKTVYKGNKNKVTIICKEHGEFQQLPSNHYKYNCNKCGRKIAKNKIISNAYEELITKFYQVHGDKYDYSKVKYTGCYKNVIITCKIHGEFEQTPSHHLNTKGCKLCCGIYKKTIDEFVDKSKEFYKDKYDYSNVKYVNCKAKVLLKCIKHDNEFEITPDAHLNSVSQNSSGGCAMCHKETMKSIFMKSKENFIAESVIKYSNWFDYSKVEYDGAKKFITLICKKHNNEFEITPDTHLNKATTCGGCKICRADLLNSLFSKGGEKFIEESKKIHGNIYDYSKVNYINGTTKVIIGCKKHGEFEIIPESHIYVNQGCDKCICKRFSKISINWLNFISKYENIDIQHAENNCEFKIPNTKYHADGYCKENNTVYEFHGTLWHGDPRVYNSNDMSYFGCKYGDLYEKTIKREQTIKDCGFNLITMWEYDWYKINESMKKLQKKYKKSYKQNKAFHQQV